MAEIETFHFSPKVYSFGHCETYPVDWLEVIGKLREEGLTQAKIGERIGWSREAVLHHTRIIDKIDTKILKFAKGFQGGRVSTADTNVSFNFTEGWFRNSHCLAHARVVLLPKNGNFRFLVNYQR